MNTDKHRSEFGTLNSQFKMPSLLSASRRLGGLVLLLLTAYFSLLTAQTRDYTRWVNPFIGTGGHGHTFPGATLPFGMVQLSPDTRIDNWDGSSGYHYSDNIIYGFSHTHLSGTGIPDGCDILFMPTVGEPQFFAKEGDKSVNGYASKFSHANEKAEPGYYSVLLDDDGIFAELTATKRVGFHRYTFPSSTQANVILDLGWRDKVLDFEWKKIGNTRVEGFRRSSSWAKDQAVYFVAEFSKPFNENLFDRITILPGENGPSKSASFQFKTTAREQVLLKVAISYVSIEGARKNLEAELPHWDFDKVRADARSAWNKELSKIEVSGGTDEQTTNFYTALYHTMIHPNVFNDVDGSYRGHDGKTHNINRRDAETQRGNANVKDGLKNSASQRLGGESSDQYTVFSLWDTFRAAHPLYTIIDQKRTVDFINSFIRIYEQGGRLPVWELWGEETDTMIGYHSVSVIADAMAKGIEGFDYEKAYAAAKHSARLDHHGLAAYKKRGYISGEDDNESVSKTLEYAYNDACIALMANILCDKRIAKNCDRSKSPSVYHHPDGKEFGSRALNYQNLFDPQTGFMRPRRNGGWIEPFKPNEVTFHFTEGNSWQYTFFVPHDVPGLVGLYGGRPAFAKKLDELFTTDQKLIGREQPDITGLIGQYAHGNEPSHHIPYLFNYADQPAKTQKYVRKIMDEFYTNAPDGLIGNEDCGQMSAWYVLSALGFYPVTPGLARYDLGTPLFKEAKINLENGKTFTVKAPNVSQSNFFVHSRRLNGRNLSSPQWLYHNAIMNGGTLEFEMSDTAPDYRVPSSLNWGNPLVQFVPSVPVVSGGSRIFRDSFSITLSTHTPGATIYYTLDGSQPSPEYNRYTGPIKIDQDTTLKAIAVKRDRRSLVAESIFTKRKNDWTAKLFSEYNSQYPGNGEDTIIDGLRGNANFAAGEWQGFWGRPFEAVIDMKRPTRVNRVGGSFLQTVRSWIWMPDRIEFEASDDGVSFRKIAEIKTDFPVRDEKPQIKEFFNTLPEPITARYIRVRAHNFGKIPEWHLGAGGDPWIFVDEIFID